MKTIKLPFANAKIAFINGNRSVNGKRLLESIKEYGILRPIDIIPYGEIKNQNITLTDVHTGNVIENPSDDYFVVLDGQHRLSCVLQLFNEHRESQVGNCDEVVPTILSTQTCTMHVTSKDYTLSPISALLIVLPNAGARMTLLTAHMYVMEMT